MKQCLNGTRNRPAGQLTKVAMVSLFLTRSRQQLQLVRFQLCAHASQFQKLSMHHVFCCRYGSEAH